MYPDNVSIKAHAVLREFSDSTLSLEPEALRQKGERVATTLRLFVGDRLPEPAYDVAALLPLARAIQTTDEHQQKSAAAWALLDYFTEPNDQRMNDEAIRYGLDVLGDFATIDAAVADYQERIAAHDTAFGRQVMRSIRLEDDARLSRHEWLDARAGVNVPKIRDVAHEVNVESLVIGAASLLDDIMHEQQPDRQLHNLMMAETFYCPVLDALGLWAMDSALRNAANRVRLINAQREDVLEKATAALRPIKLIGQERVIEALLGTSLAHAKTRFHFENDIPGGATMHLVDADMRLEGLNEEVRVISRIKGIESLAVKMLEKPAYADTLPSDLIGMTLITQGEAQLAAVFNHVVERIASSADCHFSVAASKSRPVFIKGGDEFIASLKDKLSPEVIALAEFKSNNESISAYQVAKMTLCITIGEVVIPVEIQTQTEADHVRAETGDAPHFIQKTLSVSDAMPGNIHGAPNDLLAIRDRKRTWLGLHRNVIVVGNNGEQFAESLYSSAE